MKMLEPATYMTVQEVADELGVTTGRVRQWLMQKRLQGVKHGSAWAIDRKVVERFAKQERKPGNPNFAKRTRRRRR